MTVSFVGTSMGSAIGLYAWDKAGWAGVCLAGVLLTLSALLIYCVTYKKERPAAGGLSEMR
jgi:predicted MFS family arabinose efflux permease